MADRKRRWTFGIIALTIFIRAAAPNGSGQAAGREIAEEPAFELEFRGDDPLVLEKVETLIPVGAGMVAGAIDVLAEGWSAMSAEERDLFLRFFDPSGTGEVDETFVREVISNYRRIQLEFEAGLVVQMDPENPKCKLMRLYHTDFSKVYVCPYILVEENVNRMGRDFVHELAHMAFFSYDRAFYSETSTRYAVLTPRGPQGSQLPLIGWIVRELARSDTLHHPDAYSWFAYELALAADADHVQG